jgi:hypothetical protein
MVVADTFHVVGLYPHDPALLSKFEAADVVAAGAVGSSNQPSSPRATTTQSFNPFAFNSFSRALAGQDAWRREPSPANIDLAACLGVKSDPAHHATSEKESGPNFAVVTLLLLIEDEFERFPPHEVI